MARQSFGRLGVGLDGSSRVRSPCRTGVPRKRPPGKRGKGKSRGVPKSSMASIHQTPSHPDFRPSTRDVRLPLPCLRCFASSPKSFTTAWRKASTCSSTDWVARSSIGMTRSRWWNARGSRRTSWKAPNTPVRFVVAYTQEYCTVSRRFHIPCYPSCLTDRVPGYFE